MANEVNVGIKLGADVSGGVQSREELDKLRKKAKETSAARRFVETVAQWCGVSISTRSSNAWLDVD